jgi:hypothetical protein
MSRAIIVANRTWEADPLVAVLTSAAGAAITGKPFVPAGAKDPRGLRGRVDGGQGHLVEIRCIQDTLPPNVNASNTDEKSKVLPGMLAGADVRAVIAFGTASRYDNASFNGCVAAGTNIFVHDPRPPQSPSRWTPPRADQIIASDLGEVAFGALFVMPPADLAKLQLLLLPPPLNPAQPPAYLADYTSVALSDVNITNYADYAWADIETVAVYLKQQHIFKIASLETTHGVIRSCSDAPFAFISGIVDRLGHFDEDVTPRVDAQNFVGAHNAGIVTAFVVARLLRWLPTQP